MSPAIYNEIEPFACDWMENLINAGHIAPGVVERRSVSELGPGDVSGDGQRHFFAGIGVWSAALRLAGWPDELSVWTGSCPCQPFSVAGRRGGTSDARHLWPDWFRIIRECRPAVVFGEQVASADGLAWLDDVLADLENAGYACAAADLCAASVGAPHKRSRLYFVAHTDGIARRLLEAQRQPRGSSAQAVGGGEVGGLADSDGERFRPRGAGGTLRVGAEQPSGLCSADELGDAVGARSGRDTGAVPGAQAQGSSEWSDARRVVDVSVSAGATRGFWGDAEWLACRDGKARPVEPGTFPLAHGATASVGRRRAYGNAIERNTAATFIAAAMQAIGGAA